MIKVFHVEDYTIMRDGVKFLISGDPSIQLVGQSSDEETLFAFLKNNPVDVLLLDIYLDGMQALKATNGFAIAKKIKSAYPNIKIMAHSAFDDADSVAKMLTAGASGFVSKKTGFQELIYGIKEIAAGRLFICSQTAGRMKNLQKFLLGIEGTLKDKNELFSPREREILTLLGNGASSKDIAATLFITERTVETHRGNMIQKANVKNTVELVAYASALGLIRPEPV